MVDWREEEARNETIFREMNEWTEEDNDSRLGLVREMDIYVCECGDIRCSEPIRMSRAEYESVRSFPIRFAIAVNHENPEIDKLLVENERFATIEKWHGRPAAIAREADPRR